MKRLVFVVLSISALASCRREADEETFSIKKSDLIGTWSNKSENEFLLFKDSVALPSNFYLYTDWKLVGNKIMIYNIESKPREDSIWIEYLIHKFSKDSIVLTSLAFNADSSKVTLHRQQSNTENIINYIKLKKTTYPDQDPFFETLVNSNGEVYLKEFNKEGDTLISECSFQQSEMNTLNSLIDRTAFSKIDSIYVSGISDQEYYLIEISITISKKPLIVLVDTGGIAPSTISRIITFVWSTVKLNCTPDRYNDWRAVNF